MSPRLTRPKKILLVIVAGALVLELAYVVAANVALRSSFVSSFVNRRPEKFRMEWQSAWTVLPGVVHLEAVAIRGQTRKVQWYAELDRVRAGIRLSGLPFRRFATRAVVGHGLAFRLRRIVSDVSEVDEAAPPIPGLTNPPDHLPAPRPQTGRPWRIALDDVDVDEVREVWIDRYRLAGDDGVLEGNLRVEIRGPLELRDAELRTSGGLSVGGRSIASRLALRLAVEIEPLVPRESNAADVFGRMSGLAELDAEDSSFGFGERYLPPWLDVGGHGPLHLRMSVERGELRAPSKLEVEAVSLEARFFDHAASGAGRVVATVVDGANGPEAELAARLDRFEMGRRGASAPYLHGQGFAITARAERPSLARGADDVAVSIDLPDTEISDFSAFGAYLPERSGLGLRGGSGTLRAKLAASTASRTGSGEVELEGSGVHLSFDEVGLAGDLTMRVELAEASAPPAGKGLTFDVRRADVALERVRVADAGDVKTAEWWSRATVERGRLEIEPLRLHAFVGAQLADTRPVMEILGEKSVLLEWLDRALTVRDVSARAELDVDRERVRLDALDVAGEKFELEGWLELGQGARSGLVFIGWHGLSAAVEVTPEGREWKLLHPRRWYEERLAASDRR